MVGRVNSRGKVATTAVIVLAVLVLGLVVFAFRHVNAEADEATSGPAGPLTGKPIHTQKAALWIGDSYTAGTGADEPDTSEAFETCGRLGWVCYTDAQGSTGFLNNGHALAKANRPLPKRLADDAREYRPDIVVVDAGRNDTDASPDELAATATDYFARLHQAFPKARLVAIAPYWMNPATPVPAGFAAVERGLVEKYGGTFIDPKAAGWINDQSAQLVIADRAHPNQAGHNYLGRHLAAAVKASRGR